MVMCHRMVANLAAYDRFVTIWLENTDYASAAASSTFQKLAAEGILLTSYHGVTHPSEPNYVAAMMGDFCKWRFEKWCTSPGGG